ncbi:hypothetical protein [Streptomyces sp. SDr-06]|uniref:hypothetical protein n=1 Tax=Streptomyces sp. SDr-06 TaxID=2267702 RepID=UPI0011C082AF|nr:hypothetical protein [Streptomyces sp. SDr-06]
MEILSSSQMFALGRLVLVVFGIAWLIIACALAFSNARSYRRSVTVRARCMRVEKVSAKEFTHLLRRKSVGGERAEVLLRTKKEARLKVNDEIPITYDPKNAHLIYVGENYPRFTHARAIGLFLAIALIAFLASLV